MIEISFLLVEFFSSSLKSLVSLLFNNIFPLVGMSSKASKCKKDDFPEPEGPTKATSSPRLILILTFLKSSMFPFLCS